jgi:drug/metabolite transporter (DMT)-like permease
VLRGRQGFVLLVIVTMIWGTTFPLVKTLGETLSAPTIITVRFAVAAIALAPWLRRLTWPRLRDGMLIGAVSFASYATQTIGLQTVSSGRAAFVTALNVIMVPLALPFLGRRVQRIVLLAAVVAILGIALLSWDDGAFRFSVGDLWVLGCAVAYAMYVLLLERFASRYDVLEFSAVQIMTVGFLGLTWLLLDGGRENIRQLTNASFGSWTTLAYLGLVAVAVTTLLQTHAQRSVPAPTAAVVYSLEPVFGAAASFAWRGERLAPLGFVGAALVLVAMVLSQRADILGAVDG